MTNHKEHTTQYSAADILRYVQGKMSAGDMHALEKAALDDPFLADAIEGMQQALQQHDEAAVHGGLQQLRQQLQTRTPKKDDKAAPTISFRWWKMAAAAVILVVASVWVYNAFNKKSVSEQVAQTTAANHVPPTQALTPSSKANENQVAAADSTATPLTSLKVKEEEKKQPVHTSEPKEETYRLKEEKVSKPMEIPSAAAPAPATIAEVQPVDSKNASESLYKNNFAPPAENRKAAVVQNALLAKRRQVMERDQLDKAELETMVIGAKADSMQWTKKKTSKDLSGIIKGRVTDQNNNPVAYAYLQLPYTYNNRKINNNYYTDRAGYFTIPATDSIVNVAVNVSGYGRQSFVLKNNAAVMNQLQLLPANTQKYDIQAKMPSLQNGSGFQTSYPTVIVRDAEPAYGWVAYEQYLEKNKKKPEDGANLTGNVVVSFEVHKKGALSGFNIEQSLSKAYDDEAIRLITQGPAWKLLKGHKARVTVIVHF